MPSAGLFVDPEFIVAPVNRRTGVHEPGQPAAGGDGWRRDVLELVREFGVTVARYPGGNAVSGYRRQDDGGRSPPARPTPAGSTWRTARTNEFGIDPFARRDAADLEVMLAVNLAVPGPQKSDQAAASVEETP